VRARARGVVGAGVVVRGAQEGVLVSAVALDNACPALFGLHIGHKQAGAGAGPHPGPEVITTNSAGMEEQSVVQEDVWDCPW
jgi:hypothetical protein